MRASRAAARLPFSVVAALILAGVAPAGALAAQVVRFDSTLSFNAGFGETNRLTVTLTDGAYTFADELAAVTSAEPDCMRPTPNTVTCSAAGITALEINTGDEGDTATVLAPTPSLFRGGPGDDTLTGGDGPDELHGEQGDDILAGGSGDDELLGEERRTSELGANVLDGGRGADSLRGGEGPDAMQGGGGDDTVHGGGGPDDLDGGDGLDAVIGAAGNDTMRGGPDDDQVGSTSREGEDAELGDDTLEGGAGDDLLRPGIGPSGGVGDGDTLRGGAGSRDSVTYEQRDDRVEVSLDGAANDGRAGEGDNVAGDVERLVGGQAGDTLLGGPAADTIDGFTGADTIDGGPGDDALDGGVDDAESDGVSGGEGDDQVRGNAGDDSLRGDDGRDVVEGGGGDDRLGGGGGEDSMTGGPGVDDLAGGAGNDDLDGSAPGPVGQDGGDNLRGDEGNDSLSGGDGDDVVAGGTGTDVMSGGGGRDTADYIAARAGVTVTLNGRPDDGEARERDNVRDDVENVSGGGVKDTFTGDSDANTLDGGAGEDFVDGRRGGDELRGGRSIDVVRARDGRRDVVDCGLAADFAIADPADRLRNCERRDLGRGRPTVGRDVVVQPGSSGAEFGLQQMTRTVPLLDRIEVPVGTVIDTRKGAARLVAARSRRRRGVARLARGLFSVLQRRSQRAVPELRLKGGNFGKCRPTRRGSATAARLSRRTIRRLRVRARGRFRTRGRYSAATVRGTVFSVQDRCDGTLTRVRRGVVTVRDFRRRRTVLVKAGRSHLARAPVR